MPFHQRFPTSSFRRGVGVLATWVVVGCGRIGYEPTADTQAPVGASSVTANPEASATAAASVSASTAPVATSAAISSGVPSPGASAGASATASAQASALATSAPAASPSADAGVAPSVDTVFVPDTAVANEPDAQVTQDADVDSGVPADDAAVPDAQVEPPYTGMPSPCASITGAWTLSVPEHLSALSSSAWDGEFSLSADGLTLRFSSGRNLANNLDLFRTTRPNRSSAFATPQADPVDDPSHNNQLKLEVLPNSLRAILVASGTQTDFFWVSRATLSDTWSNLTPITELNTGSSEWDPWLSADGLRLYYSTDKPGSGPGSKELLLATRASSNASFGTPQSITELNTAAAEGNPVLSADERFVVFSREGDMAPDPSELYISYRANAGSAFGTPQLLPGLNTSAWESEPLLSADGCELFFASDRSGTLGSFDIYRSVIVPD